MPITDNDIRTAEVVGRFELRNPRDFCEVCHMRNRPGRGSRGYVLRLRDGRRVHVGGRCARNYQLSYEGRLLIEKVDEAHWVPLAEPERD